MKKYIAFLKVLETGSFTRAADILGYTQPALSLMITSLEDELSMQLMRRSRYGISLTPEGESLLPAIRSTVAQYQSMQALVSEIRGLDTGLIRIGTFASISNEWFPELVEGFWKDYPGIRFDLIQGDYSSIAEQVRTGQLDMGLVNGDSVQNMDSIYLETDEFFAVVPKGHPYSDRDSISIQEIAAEPYLMLRAGDDGAYSEAAEAFEIAGITPDTRLSAHDDYTIMTMVERGLGVSIMSERIIRSSKRNIAAIPIDPPIRRRICLISRDKKTLPVACRTFIRFITNRYTQ